MPKHVIALVFDFDDTLVPDSTTAFLTSRGIDAEEFWKVKAKSLIEKGWDPVHAYLKLILDMVKPGQPLQDLTNKDLIEFGKTLQPYPGLINFFSRIKKIVDEKYSSLEIAVEFWVISGGLEDIIRGCAKIRNHLSGFWGCRLGSDTDGGPINSIMRTISFTEKTRYLFEINKGLSPEQTDKNPMLVNKRVSDSERRVHFENMIYVGDGLTDIPCFSLIEKNNGLAFGVLQRDKKGAAKREVFENLVLDRRVKSLHSPKYGTKDDLGTMLEAAIINRCAAIQLRSEQALRY